MLFLLRAEMRPHRGGCGTLGSDEARLVDAHRDHILRGPEAADTPRCVLNGYTQVLDWASERGSTCEIPCDARELFKGVVVVV